MNFEDLIIGASFFSSGGGGDISDSRKLFASIRNDIELVDVGTLPESGIFITAFGVGATSVRSQRGLHINLIKKYLLPFLPGPLAGVIPVEIGPKSIAQAFYVADQLGVPVIDADIVGGRASPEVYLESITLHRIPRVPLLVMNEQRDVCLYLQSANEKAEESFLRYFSSLSNQQAEVVGYALTGGQVKNCLERGTISKALETGASIRGGMTEKALDGLKAQRLLTGTITKIEKIKSRGFSELNVELESSEGHARLYLRNEALIVWLNEMPIATCPSIIVLLDSCGRPLASSELTYDLVVNLFVLNPPKVWDCTEGRNLFSPRQFGFNFDPI